MAMQVQINWASVEKTDALEAHVEKEIEHAFGRFADRLTRVEVHLSDVNAAKHGPDDKVCRIEARPKGRDPLVVDDHSGDLYAAIAGAAGKMKRALEKRLDPHS